MQLGPVTSQATERDCADDGNSYAQPGALHQVIAVGDEPGDILNYALERAAFSHDSTLNQWLTES